MRSMSSPRRCLSRPGRAYSLGRTPLRRGLSRSMATMASSTILPMVGCLALAWQVRPAGLLGHPEDVLGFVFVFVLGVGARVVALARDEFGAVFLEGVGDVLEEDEAEDDVLVFRRVHVVAELVRGQPQLGLETEGGSRLLGI